MIINSVIVEIDIRLKLISIRGHSTIMRVIKSDLKWSKRPPIKGNND